MCQNLGHYISSFTPVQGSLNRSNWPFGPAGVPRYGRGAPCRASSSRAARSATATTCRARSSIGRRQGPPKSSPATSASVFKAVAGRYVRIVLATTHPTAVAPLLRDNTATLADNGKMLLRLLFRQILQLCRRVRIAKHRVSASRIWHETFLPPGTPQPLPSRTGVERHPQTFAPRSRDGVRGRPPVLARWRSRCAERGLRQAGRVAARPAAGCPRLQSSICCGPTIPQVWPGMSSVGLKARRAGTDGIHGVRLLLGIERSKGKRRSPFHGRGRAAKGRSCGFFGQLIAARQSLQLMNSCLRLYSKQHVRRAGSWLRLSTSGILSDQKV